MGTSKSYSMPSGGNWTPLKTSATTFLKAEGGTTEALPRMLRNYIRAMGGAAAISSRRGSGRSQASTGGAVSGAAPATAAAQQLGNFFSGVAESGLESALQESGLGQFVGQSATDILAAMLDLIAGPASTLDESAARDAVVALSEELFETAKTAEDLETAIQGAMDEQGLAGMLQEFFTQYLYAQFCRDFYEVWQKKEGDERAAAALADVKEYMRESVIGASINDISGKVDWFGPTGEKLCRDIMQDTLAIFEVEE